MLTSQGHCIAFIMKAESQEIARLCAGPPDSHIIRMYLTNNPRIPFSEPCFRRRFILVHVVHINC